MIFISMHAGYNHIPTHLPFSIQHPSIFDFMAQTRGPKSRQLRP